MNKYPEILTEEVYVALLNTAHSKVFTELVTDVLGHDVTEATNYETFRTFKTILDVLFSETINAREKRNGWKTS